MAAHQTPLSLGFSRQEHWSELPFPSPMHESEKWKWSRSVVSDSATPWTAAYQAPPSMGFSRQEYWSSVPELGYLFDCFLVSWGMPILLWTFPLALFYSVPQVLGCCISIFIRFHAYFDEYFDFFCDLLVIQKCVVQPPYARWILNHWTTREIPQGVFW